MHYSAAATTCERRLLINGIITRRATRVRERESGISEKRAVFARRRLKSWRDKEGKGCLLWLECAGFVVAAF